MAVFSTPTGERDTKASAAKAEVGAGPGQGQAVSESGRSAGLLSQWRGVVRVDPRQTPCQVLGAGVDTWSPCWYVERDSPQARALRSLARRPKGRAWMLPDPVGGHRIGWFLDSGLVFAEGHPWKQGPCPALHLADALRPLLRALSELGIGAPAVEGICLRRLDVAVDLGFPADGGGLAILEALAAGGAPAGGKVVTFRAERCLETVLWTSRGGGVAARAYDKGGETGLARRGRWLRFEAQWRAGRGRRPRVAGLQPDDLRQKFAGRFKGIFPKAGAPKLTAAQIAGQLGGAIDDGALLPSRARTLVGYLYLADAGLAQGAPRTVARLERECRELGLTISFESGVRGELDLAEIFEECLAEIVWERG